MDIVFEHRAAGALLAGLLAAAAPGGGPSSARAAIAQMPLGSAAAPAPSVMFTLDDSGSMDLECLPDALCTDDQDHVGAVPWAMGSFKNAVATYDPASLFARRLRSDANPLYYHPASRYQPWLLADGRRAAAFPANAAPPDPRRPDDTVDLSAGVSLGTRWCDRIGACEERLERFRPALYHRLVPGTSGDAPEHYAPVFIEAGMVAEPKAPARTDCAGDRCTAAEELQNFSNWFTYSRSRLLLAIGGAMEQVARLPDRTRLGFATLNGPAGEVDGQPTSTVQLGVRALDSAGRERFHAALRSTRARPGGTPLRRALDDVGRYFSRADAHGPWAEKPADGEPGASQAACRRAAHVLVTDGIWNMEGARTPEAAADVDSQAGPVLASADGRSTWQYRPGPPYAGQGGGTLADVAMYHWYRDLRPDLPNAVPTDSRSPAFWQHLVQHTVAIGVRGHLREPDDLPALAAGTLAWGTPGLGQQAANIDDLWHAAVNARGTASTATDPAGYLAGLNRALAEASSAPPLPQGAMGLAGIALSTAGAEEGTLSFQPSFDPADWSGDLEARRQSDGLLLWRASRALPAPALRRIFSYDAASGRAVPFTMAGLDGAGLVPRLGTDDAAGLVAWVRGETPDPSSGWRSRRTSLGDIVNSTPLYVGDRYDGQYDFLTPGSPGRLDYRAYLQAKRARAGQVFVGANDGMLHAFDAASGRETFAFVPGSVLQRLAPAARRDAPHRYLVDGPLVEADVFDDSAGTWRNLVLGTSGAGERNLFAIRVPVGRPPTSPSTAGDAPAAVAADPPSADDILWERSADSPGFEGLGHVLQPVQAGVLSNGRWVIVTGNGLDSDDGRARLLVVDALSGALLRTIDLPGVQGGPGPSRPDGLGGVALLQDAERRILAAYAGDLQGRMWSFDLRGGDPARWRIASGGRPLFEARGPKGEPEPITAAPAIVRHPAGGAMVLFGTGKFSDAADPADTGSRGLYGIWDRRSGADAQGAPADDVARTAADPGPAAVALEELVTQRVVPATSVAGAGRGYGSVVSNVVDYGDREGARRRGWRIALDAASGQRSVHAPQLAGGRALFQTMTPGDGADREADPCVARAAIGHVFVLDPFTGGGEAGRPVFDTDGEGRVTPADAASAVVVTIDGMARRALLRQPGSRLALEGGWSAPSGAAPFPPPSGSGRADGVEPAGGAGPEGGGGLERRAVEVQLDRQPTARYWREIVPAPAYE
ncbi:MAG: hypothetical protein EOO24_00825 [Comamonadaceae bacterium]|nr:MAG: hypothetical protein EOO24_00825 [Comamonadaceae bacterium]